MAITPDSVLAPSPPALTPAARKRLAGKQVKSESVDNTPISTPGTYHGNDKRSSNKKKPVTHTLSSEGADHVDTLVVTLKTLNLSPEISDSRSSSSVKVTETSKSTTQRRSRSSTGPIQRNSTGKVTEEEHQSTTGEQSNQASQPIVKNQRSTGKQTSKLAPKPPSAQSPRSTVNPFGRSGLKQSTKNTSSLGPDANQTRGRDIFKSNVHKPNKELSVGSEDSSESVFDYSQVPAAYDSSATESDLEEIRASTPSKVKKPVQLRKSSVSRIPKRSSHSFVAAPITSHSGSPITPQQIIGGNGEKLFADSAEKSVAGFNKISHWTSKLRRHYNLPPYGPAEETDMKFLDEDGELSKLLRKDIAGTIPKWLNKACLPGEKERPRYWMEVKTTAGECKSPLFVTKIQYSLMKEKAIRGKGMPTDVYVLIRVFDIDSENPQYKVYIDPWKLIKGGSLTIVAYKMTTG